MWMVWFDKIFVCCMTGMLLFHVIGWQLGWIVGIAVWGVAMCGLRIWRMPGSDRRSILDMAAIAVPALLFAGVSAAVSVTVMPESMTPALLVSIMTCGRLSIPYMLHGIEAMRRLSARPA